TDELELDGEFFPPKTCRAAQETLLLIASALVSGVIGDGWQLKPRPQKRGRPKRTLKETVELDDVLNDYKHVLGFLKGRELRWEQSESMEQCQRRLKPILRQAWTETIGVRYESGAPKPDGDLFDTKIIRHPIELPEKRLDDCLREAL